MDDRLTAPSQPLQPSGHTLGALPCLPFSTLLQALRPASPAAPVALLQTEPGLGGGISHDLHGVFPQACGKLFTDQDS